MTGRDATAAADLTNNEEDALVLAQLHRSVSSVAGAGSGSGAAQVAFPDAWKGLVGGGGDDLTPSEIQGLAGAMEGASSSLGGSRAPSVHDAEVNFEERFSRFREASQWCLRRNDASERSEASLKMEVKAAAEDFLRGRSKRKRKRTGDQLHSFLAHGDKSTSGNVETGRKRSGAKRKRRRSPLPPLPPSSPKLAPKQYFPGLSSQGVGRSKTWASQSSLEALGKNFIRSARIPLSSLEELKQLCVQGPTTMSRICAMRALKLLRLVSSTAFCDFARFEWFYSAIDVGFFSETPFANILAHMAVDTCRQKPRMTRAEWCVVRRAMGKRRRFSGAFIDGRRYELSKSRERARLERVREGSSMTGTIVSALHPVTRRPEAGVLLGFLYQVDYTIDCLVRFQTPFLGVRRVPDISIASELPFHSSRQSVSSGNVRSSIVESLDESLDRAQEMVRLLDSKALLVAHIGYLHDCVEADSVASSSAEPAALDAAFLAEYRWTWMAIRCVNRQLDAMFPHHHTISSNSAYLDTIICGATAPSASPAVAKDGTSAAEFSLWLKKRKDGVAGSTLQEECLDYFQKANATMGGDDTVASGCAAILRALLNVSADANEGQVAKVKSALDVLKQFVDDEASKIECKNSTGKKKIKAALQKLIDAVGLLR